MYIYSVPSSPVCRSVLMTAKAVGVEVHQKFLNLQAGDQLKPEFLKLNPQHTIPTLVDCDFTLWESRAIMIYLVEKYAKDDSLYPKCPQKQAKINQILYFDMGTLYASFTNYFYPQFQQLPADPELFKKIENALEFLNRFLEENQYVAGDSLTIADISLLATISSFAAIDFDFSKYSNIIRWYNKCKTTVPGWDENWKGCLEFKNFFDNVMEANVKK